jgi:uncharacterized Zn-binding protein involved in type VI secretion
METASLRSLPSGKVYDMYRDLASWYRMIDPALADPANKFPTMPNVIRLGDPTFHGGKVISASASDYLVDGIAVVRVDDQCSCPIPGHSVTKVMEGDADYIVEGKPVALADTRLVVARS